MANSECGRCAPAPGLKQSLRACSGAVALAALASCATYAPRPLPQHDDLADRLPLAQGEGRVPLDMNAVATLAVLNNPNLKAARATMHVAAAQAFAAGILPNPQFNAGGERPNDHVTSPRDPRYPEYSAYGLGLAIDLRALLTHASARAAADASYRQAQGDLLWQEWQTVAEARTLYVAQTIAAERRAFLAPAADQYALAASRSQRALAQGNVTLEQAGADQAALAAIRTQQGIAERAALQAERGLHALVGIRPEVTVLLQPLTPPVIPDRAQVVAAAGRLAQTRPDLRALQEGYRSEEAQVRIAVLSQFPNIIVGITRARDVSDVHTTGVTVALDLPLFDRGQGDMAIKGATREQLRAEYQARLDQASTDIWQLWQEMQELHTELDDLQQRLPLLQQSVDNSKRVFTAGDLPAVNYLTLVNAYLVAQGSRFDLLQNLWSDSIAIAALMGTQLQPDSSGLVGLQAQ